MVGCFRSSHLAQGHWGWNHPWLKFGEQYGLRRGNPPKKEKIWWVFAKGHQATEMGEHSVVTGSLALLLLGLPKDHSMTVHHDESA